MDEEIDKGQTEVEAFQQGYAEASGAEPKDQPTAEAEVIPEKEEPAEALVAGIPESQVKELLAKAAEFDAMKSELAQTRDRLYGKIGEVQRAMQEMRNQPGPQLNKVTLKRLSQDYPELAEVLMQDLSEIPGSQGGGFDMPAIEEKISSGRAQLEREFSTKLEVAKLDIMAPDWREVAQSADFKLWKQNLAPEVQMQLDSSNDAGFIATGISEFKKWKDKAKSTSATRQQRLEQAITPTGVPSNQTSTADEADAFRAGYKQARGVRT